ncbi:AAA domain-containing protein [Amycolatopsis sp. NPDC003731]
MSFARADVVVRAILSKQSRGAARFTTLSDDGETLDGVEVLAGTIYRYPQILNDKQRVSLTVYLGLGDVGGQLWEQEYRVLQRIGHLGHSSLPKLEDGGFIPAANLVGVDSADGGAGYIRTWVYGENRVDDAAAMADYLSKHPEEALRHFWYLADGLAILHDASIAHRNLWPGTLEFDTTTSEEHGGRIRLARFEMSTMVSNLLRANRLGSAGAANVRNLYLSQHERFLAYAPPERVEFLLGAGADVGGSAGDVYSLGMIGAEWILGSNLVKGAPTTATGLVEFRKAVRRQIGNSDLPIPLIELLRGMLEDAPRARPEMAEVMSKMSEHYHGMLEGLRPRQDNDKPYLVAYMRGRPDSVFLPWKAISEPSTTDIGEKELAELIESDLKGATVCHSPDGALPFVQAGQEESRRRATTVLFGQNYVWFTETLFRTAGFGRKVHFKNIQVVKYVLQKHRIPPRLHELRKTSLSRNIFAVESIDFATDIELLERRGQGRPDWGSLTQSTAQRLVHTSLAQRYLDGLEWYLEYQAAKFYTREFSFVRESAAGAVKAVLRWDREADRRRAHLLPAMHGKLLSSERYRVALGDFFAEAANDDPGGIQVEVRFDDAGRPGKRVGVYRLDDARGQESIVLDVAHYPRMPERGWVRLESDKVSRRALERQVVAVSELAGNHVLLENLVRPESNQGRPGRWAAAGGELEGEGREAVRAMLEHETMFALQGPPGTGKTEVTSQAVAEFLAVDPRARVLVSAQSHDALDNLAARILSKINALDTGLQPARSDWVALRLASDHTSKSVAESIAPFMEDRLVPRVQKDIIQRVDARLKERRFTSKEIAGLLGEWRSAVSESGLELRMRIRRGANLVFATTGAATRGRLVEQATNEPFDWVLVEEAAKAWPTELALPLVRGLRWTLVGDQAQIGAFARQEVERFLDDCHDDPNPEVASWWEAKEHFLAAFSTFGQMFAEDVPDAPRLRLSEQRRMRDPIAQVVGRGFYSGGEGPGLITRRNDRDHGLTQPRWLRGRPLVWVDTGTTQQAKGFWYNETEAEIVAALLRGIRPALQPSGRTRTSRVAVVTPYRKQVERIQQGAAEFASDIWTVDSFQGREADVVIASLVRDRDSRGDGATMYSSLGHLADPARANVMLSRARDLLVIVGRLSLYENCAVPEWRAAAAAVRELGRIVPSEEVRAG